jgi:serine/threonine protein kinase
VEQWRGFNGSQIKDRCERLHDFFTVEEAEHGPGGRSKIKLGDFEVIKHLANGANAMAYLAKCRPEGQLADHTDALVVLKVLVHYKQFVDSSDLVNTQSKVDANFTSEAQKEAKGPNIPEFRANIVHVLGKFYDDALELEEYKAMDPAGDFMRPDTWFIVLPFYCGGDLGNVIDDLKPLPPPPVPHEEPPPAEGEPHLLPEKKVLTYLTQMLDAVGA